MGVPLTGTFPTVPTVPRLSPRRDKARGLLRFRVRGADCRARATTTANAMFI
jgi:hypothetical protein